MDAITSGAGNTCALTTTGGVECWGWNYYGQLGNGTDHGPQNCGDIEVPIACSTTPIAVSGLGSGVSALTAGYAHTCALMSAGGVECWGYNAAGQLGDGTNTGPEKCGQYPTACSTTPVAVQLPDGVTATAIAAGWDHTCAVTSAGGVECWGANSEGQLGDGTTTESSTPVAVQLPDGVTATALAGGGQHTCALTSAGGVLCWGYNEWGQLGDGTNTGPQTCGKEPYPCSTNPVAVQLPEGVTAIAITSGGYHTCAITSIGGVLCWGRNDEGELGDGTTTESWTPVAVQLPSGVMATAITSEAYHTCAVTNVSDALCWGENLNGQLGDGTATGPQTCDEESVPCSTIPVAVSGLESGASAFATGWEYTCAVTGAGDVECWGYSRNGALGDGDTLFNLTPAQVSGLMWSLPVSTSGAGSGTVSSTPAGIDCGGPGHAYCSALFKPGSTVLLRANPASGSGFTGFTGGGCSGDGSTCQVTMSAAQSVTATFALAPAPAPAPPGPNPPAPGTPGPSPPAPGTPPGTPEPRTPALEVSFRGKPAPVAHRHAKVELSCNGGTVGSTCSGKLLLTATRRIVSRVHHRRHVSLKTIVLARADYEVRSGNSKVVVLQLTREALALLARARHRHLLVLARATLSGGTAAQRTFTLRLPAADGEPS